MQDSVDNDRRAHPKSHDKQKLLAKIRDNIAEKLQKENLYVEEEVFLIDSYVYVSLVSSPFSTKSHFPDKTFFKIIILKSVRGKICKKV